METVFWLLAVYGILKLAIGIWRWLLSFRYVPPQVGLLFLVKDNENVVEGLFRQLALDCFFSNRYFTPNSVIVVDLGSQDQTPEIMRRLARDFSFLRFRACHEEELAQLIARFGQVLVLDMRKISSRQAIKGIRHLMDKNNIKLKTEEVPLRQESC
ncbi:MAG: hypothetical protein FH749_13780 [Firmicutes bacterium]|nr:hypothetical protein [Bacillota bacterium]